MFQPKCECICTIPILMHKMHAMNISRHINNWAEFPFIAYGIVRFTFLFLKFKQLHENHTKFNKFLIGLCRFVNSFIYHMHFNLIIVVISLTFILSSLFCLCCCCCCWKHSHDSNAFNLKMHAPFFLY